MHIFGSDVCEFNRSQSFNVGSHSHSSGAKKDKVQDPAVEHDLYVSLDDINKVRLDLLALSSTS